MARFSKLHVDRCAGWGQPRMPLLPRGPLEPTHRGVQLPPEAVDVVRDALANRPHGTQVVVFADDEIRVEDRETIVQRFKRAGVREIATRLKYALVPPLHALCLVDLEVGTRVCIMPLAKLFGGQL